MKIISKKDAIEAGLVKFYTGKLCKHGHDSDRRVVSSQCISCVTVNMQRYRDKQTPAQIKVTRAKARQVYRNRTPEQVEYDKEVNKAWRVRNADNWREYYKSWYEENKDKHNAYQKGYYRRKKAEAA